MSLVGVLQLKSMTQMVYVPGEQVNPFLQTVWDVYPPVGAEAAAWIKAGIDSVVGEAKDPHKEDTNYTLMALSLLL